MADSDPGTPTRHSWRMAEQYFRSHPGFELETKPHNDGYVMVVKIGVMTRRVFFDPAGRITHTLNLNDPSQPEEAKLI